MDDNLPNIVGRIKATLPVGWFCDDAPILDGLLSGLADAWISAKKLIDNVAAQSRHTTAEGDWLDAIADDFFGQMLSRRLREPDAQFRTRIRTQLLRPLATRNDVVAALENLTGRLPDVFEPAWANDAGGYGLGSGSTDGLGYNVAGGWGNLSLPFQSFITVYRPLPGGIALVSGWCCPGAGYGGGVLQYANLSLMVDEISDIEIHAAVAQSLPIGVVAWTRIVD